MSDSDHKKPGNRNQDRSHQRKPCIDCVRESQANGLPLPRRKAPYPGPRCSTHARLRKSERRNITREQRWERIYGLSSDDYWAIHAEQNGTCPICQRATGTGRRRLSVDHCHKTGVVRGLCCQKCNLDILGWARDEIEFFERAIEYLLSPPAVRAIGVRVVPDFEPDEDDEARAQYPDEEPEF